MKKNLFVLSMLFSCSFYSRASLPLDELSSGTPSLIDAIYTPNGFGLVFLRRKDTERLAAVMTEHGALNGENGQLFCCYEPVESFDTSKTQAQFFEHTLEMSAEHNEKKKENHGQCSLLDKFCKTALRWYLGKQLQRPVELSSDYLSHGGYLQHLDLSHIGLQEIPERLCSGLTSLKRVLLHHNKLQRIGLEAFDGCELELLDLSHNQLQEINSEACEGLRSVATLRLGFNPLQAAPLEAVQIIDEVRVVELPHELPESSLFLKTLFKAAGVNEVKILFNDNDERSLDHEHKRLGVDIHKQFKEGILAPREVVKRLISIRGKDQLPELLAWIQMLFDVNLPIVNDGTADTVMHCVFDEYDKTRSHAHEEALVEVAARLLARGALITKKNAAGLSPLDRTVWPSCEAQAVRFFLGRCYSRYEELPADIKEIKESERCVQEINDQQEDAISCLVITRRCHQVVDGIDIFAERTQLVSPSENILKNCKFYDRRG